MLDPPPQVSGNTARWYVFLCSGISLLKPVPEDPDLEDAPVAPEMGTIELKAYRCQSLTQRRDTTRNPSSQRRSDKYVDLHLGRVSERSKKAGWHHVAYVPSVESYFRWSLLRLLLINPSSTGDEIPIAKKRSISRDVDYLDPTKGQPNASIKIFYRPRGKPGVHSRSTYLYFVQSY